MLQHTAETNKLLPYSSLSLDLAACLFVCLPVFPPLTVLEDTAEDARWGARDADTDAGGGTTKADTDPANATIATILIMEKFIFLRRD